MARYCWAKRETFGLQIERLQGVRETYRSELRHATATTCDRGYNRTCETSHQPERLTKALIQRRAWARGKNPRGRDKDHARAPMGGMRECARGEVVIQIFLSDSQETFVLRDQLGLLQKAQRTSIRNQQLRRLRCSRPNESGLQFGPAYEVKPHSRNP